VSGLNALLPTDDWRQKLAEASQPDVRKVILVSAFEECLMKAGGYKHVCETTILRPDKNRPLYSLFYGTRHDIGLEVFRDCQVKALEAQAATRATTKLDMAEEKSRQTEMFSSMHEMGANEADAPLKTEIRQNDE